MNRRYFLSTALAGSTLALAPRIATAAIAEGPFEVTRTDAEWRAMLSDLEYHVMREGGTEEAGTSPLDDEERDGIFACRGCDQPLYSSDAKYDSGTGWPSFTEPLPGAIGTMDDRRMVFFVRTEAHCSRCGSHLGHIFEDGPEPTGQRHCLNGASLVFVPS